MLGGENRGVKKLASEVQGLEGGGVYLRDNQSCFERKGGVSKGVGKEGWFKKRRTFYILCDI